MYIDTGLTDNNMDDASQPHPTVVGDSDHNSVDAVDGNSLKNASAVHMDELSSMLSFLEELDLPSEKESVENSTQATHSPTDDVNSLSEESVESHLHGNGKHTGEKPFQCSYCDKKFGHKSTLTNHLRIHNREKPFECSYCDKKFGQKRNLSIHLRIHTGVKPFKCFVCEKAFHSQRDLTNHLQIHQAEKPFKCSLCDKGFSFKQTLIEHLRIHAYEEKKRSHTDVSTVR